jgi:hypothetical protein
MVKSAIASHKKRKEDAHRAGRQIGSLYATDIQSQTLAEAANNMKEPWQQKEANACNQEGIAVQHRIEEIRDHNSGKTTERRIRIFRQRPIDLPPRQSGRTSTSRANLQTKLAAADRASSHP